MKQELSYTYLDFSFSSHFWVQVNIFLVINNFIHLAQKILSFEVIAMDTPSLYSYTSKYL